MQLRLCYAACAAAGSPHGHLELLGIDLAGAICVKKIKCLPASSSSSSFDVPGAILRGAARPSGTMTFWCFNSGHSRYVSISWFSISLCANSLHLPTQP